MTPDQLKAFSNTPTPITTNLPHSPMPGMGPGMEQASGSNLAEHIDEQLQLLADIHLPDPISWWPPAPGWWLVLFTGIFLCYLIYRFSKKKLHQSKYKKQAKSELQLIHRHWQKQQNLILTASRLSVFIRRIALAEQQMTSTLKRHDIASLTDEQWLLFIQKQQGMQAIGKNYHELLVQLPYQDPLIKFDIEEQKKLSKQIDELFNAISQWIKKGFKNA